MLWGLALAQTQRLCISARRASRMGHNRPLAPWIDVTSSSSPELRRGPVLYRHISGTLMTHPWVARCHKLISALLPTPLLAHRALIQPSRGTPTSAHSTAQTARVCFRQPHLPVLQGRSLSHIACGSRAAPQQSRRPLPSLCTFMALALPSRLFVRTMARWCRLAPRFWAQ